MEEKSTRLGFLHKICKNANHTSLAYWMQDAEFRDEITALVKSGALIDEKTVFDILRRIYLARESARLSGFESDFDFTLARATISKMWKAISGDNTGQGWGYTPKMPDPVLVPEGFEEMSDILELTSTLRRGVRRHICSSEFLTFLQDRKHDTLEDIFAAFRDFFYPMVRSGAKNDRERRKYYFKYRSVAENLCEVLYGDKYYWHFDYEEYYKDK